MAQRVGRIGSIYIYTPAPEFARIQIPAAATGDVPGSARIRGKHTWILAQIPAYKQSENTVKTLCKNTVDDGVRFVYDYDVLVMTTTCPVLALPVL